MSSPASTRLLRHELYSAIEKNDSIFFLLPFFVAFSKGVTKDERNGCSSGSSNDGLSSLGQKWRKKLMTRPLMWDPLIPGARKRDEYFVIRLHCEKSEMRDLLCILISHEHDMAIPQIAAFHQSVVFFVEIKT